MELCDRFYVVHDEEVVPCGTNRHDAGEKAKELNRRDHDKIATELEAEELARAAVAARAREEAASARQAARVVAGVRQTTTPRA